MTTPTPCSVHRCDKPAKTRGYCSTHYQRVLRDGDPGPAVLKKVRQKGPCTVDGCKEPAKTKGLCHKHYQRMNRHGTTSDEVGQASRAAFCTVEGCERKHHAKGYCTLHKSRIDHGIPLDAPPLKTPRVGTCRGPECDDEILAKGLCGAHYAQEAAGQELKPKRTYEPKTEPCKSQHCDRVGDVAGMCATHRRWWLRDPDTWDRPIPKRAPAGTGSLDKHGYRIIHVDGKPWRKHRYEATVLLGRDLRPNEDVHHLDTNRDNNETDGPFVLDDLGRLTSGNLQVWAHSHPRGGDIGPRSAWFADELEAYADVLPDAIIEQLAGIVERRRS